MSRNNELPEGFKIELREEDFTFENLKKLIIEENRKYQEEMKKKKENPLWFLPPGASYFFAKALEEINNDCNFKQKDQF